MSTKEIQALRKKLKLTQGQLALKCGVSIRTVQGWEQGNKPSGPARLILGILSK